MFIHKTDSCDNNTIRLGIENFDYWCQVAYQLSHEICHYAVYALSKNGTESTPWIEETICEAFSLYFLDYLQKNWSKTLLFVKNKYYATSVFNYLKNILERKGQDCIISRYDDFVLFNEEYATKREYRLTNRNELYRIMNSDNLKGLLIYREYMLPDSLLMDIESYERDYVSNSAVKYLCDWQREIESNISK
ncbi:MAG: hypothetical protein E7231_18390 [Cellulosilyticum sp.]|nr:hypothetical protein [Cellulosilyticum sp.]